MLITAERLWLGPGKIRHGWGARIEDDRFVAVGPLRQLREGRPLGEEVLDYGQSCLLPGLINAHCHGDMAMLKGLGDGMTLLEQMTEFGKCDWFFPYLTDEDRYYARMHTYCEALLSGTTTIVENMYWGLGQLSQQAFQKTGIRGAPAEDIRYDFMESDKFLPDKMVSDFAERCGQCGCIPVLGTLPEEEFSDSRLRETARIVNENGCLFTSHLAETQWRYDAAVEHFGISPVRVLDKYGLLNERYFGSHGVYLDDDDITILAERGVKVVNTPICEMKIADGLAPIRKLLDGGVTVALGTDGAMWNNSNDLFREMKFMTLVHNTGGAGTISPKEVLDMATVNGAKALGLEGRTGMIQEGMSGDVILIDLSAPHMTPIHYGEFDNVASSLVFCATGANVTDVFVAGEPVVRDRIITGCNLAEIQKVVQRSSSELIKKYFRR